MPNEEFIRRPIDPSELPEHAWSSYQLIDQLLGTAASVASLGARDALETLRGTHNRVVRLLAPGLGNTEIYMFFKQQEHTVLKKLKVILEPSRAGDGSAVTSDLQYQAEGIAELEDYLNNQSP